jgi:HEAT repeat protein
MRFGVIAASILTILLGGCSEPKATIAGGKPVAHWLQAVHNPDAKVRKKAVSKLGNIGAADPAALPALIGALKDRSPAVRGEAILALLKCGSIPSEAISVFVELQRNDRNAKVRGYASQALAKIQVGK